MRRAFDRGPGSQSSLIIRPSRGCCSDESEGRSPSDGTFGSFSHGPAGANTKLHWKRFWDGSDSTINNGQLIHIGWSTQDHSSSVFDMYWTDATGERIPGSVVVNITSGWTYEQFSSHASATWENSFNPGLAQPADIFDTHYLVLAGGPIPLADLNLRNEALNDMLIPLPGGELFTVSPGGPPVDIPIPETVPPGAAVILRYGVMAPGTQAESVDFVQFQVPGGETPVEESTWRAIKGLFK